MRSYILLLLAAMILPLATVGASTVTYSEQVFGTLQAAVDAANPGDTLLLPEGIIEGPVTVDKPLTIIGAGEKSMLFTYDGPSVMIINSGGVTVSKVTFLLCNTGILVEEAGAVSIEDCFFVENAVGVDIRGGAGHTLKGNSFINNVACGAILQNVEEATVEGNYFNFSQPAEFPDIQSLLGGEAGPNRIGLKLLGVSNLTVTGNTFHDIGRCVYMGNSLDCIISDNSFRSSTVGLSLKDSTYNVVEDNVGYETGELMFLWLSSFNNMSGNLNQGGVLSRDVESINLYEFDDLNLSGLNFILETGEPQLGPIFQPLSEAYNITLLPDPVTESAWARISVNTTDLHEDAIPGSLGLYDASGRLISQATISDQNTVIEYSVKDRATLVLAKKVDSEAPTAIAGTDIAGKVDEALGFDASASTDNLGIAEYRWSFGDGVESTGVKVAHAYSAPGVYTARLKVVDVAGNQSEDTVSVTVQAEEEAEENIGFNLWYVVAAVIILSIGGYIFYTQMSRK
ncbi:PKD domain-containing protein [Candidatus Bathyarchaeota archaeon]|nr:PKD domain-containing protein [Candidatus Bathyarchaeota archaeon]